LPLSPSIASRHPARYLARRGPRTGRSSCRRFYRAAVTASAVASLSRAVAQQLGAVRFKSDRRDTLLSRSALAAAAVAAVATPCHAQIQYVMMFSRQGKLRLQKWYNATMEVCPRRGRPADPASPPPPACCRLSPLLSSSGAGSCPALGQARMGGFRLHAHAARCDRDANRRKSERRRAGSLCR